MSDSKKILLTMGTRPEIIKMLPIYFELKNRGLQPLLLHTGQHNEMAESLYNLFDITPDYSIDLDRSGITQGDCELSMLSALLLQKISRVVKAADPAIVMVHGDTSSALTGALAAFYQQRPVAHVEAGLRSHNEYNPFPEEKNRVLIGQLARWHFAPTKGAQKNLLDEGIDPAHVHVVGNTIVEAARTGLTKLDTYRKKFPGPFPDLVGKLQARIDGKKMLLVTMHRRENQASTVRLMMQAVVELMMAYEDLIVVWPVHPSPAVKSVVADERHGFSDDINDRFYLTNPLNYPVLLWVLKHSWLVMTDSGGIQEEAVALNTPILVVRDTTERPEIIESGAGVLVGTDKRTIITKVEKLLQDPKKHDSMRNAKNPFGDGTTAQQICNLLMKEKIKETGVE